jgi:hypothetical protein
VVLPASGCEIIAKVRRRSTSAATGDRVGVPSGVQTGMFMASGCGSFGRFYQGCNLCGARLTSRLYSHGSTLARYPGGHLASPMDKLSSPPPDATLALLSKMRAPREG